MTFFIFKDKESESFIGACIELGIVKEGESLLEVKNDLEEAAKGYVETICKHDLSEKLLNQTLPKELMDLFKKYLNSMVSNFNDKPLKNQAPLETAEVSTRTVSDLCYA